MFTGLIETIGIIKTINKGNKSITLGIIPEMSDFDISIGGSLAVNGVCLTIISKSGDELFCTAVNETLNQSAIKNIKARDKVNLERAMRLSSRLDGHIVQGHVDGIGKIVSDRKVGDALIRTIWIPEDLRKFMASKGSIAIDGISLTIAESGDETISISLIPHSIDKTTMSIKCAGNTVNIECDLFARYIFRLLSYGITTNPDNTELNNNIKNNSNMLSILENNGF